MRWIALFFMNYTDWDRFDALERGEAAGPMASRTARCAEQLAVAELVEPLGFDSLWTFEHHAAPYVLLPTPSSSSPSTPGGPAGSTWGRWSRCSRGTTRSGWPRTSPSSSTSSAQPPLHTWGSAAAWAPRVQGDERRHGGVARALQRGPRGAPARLQPGDVLLRGPAPSTRTSPCDPGRSTRAWCSTPTPSGRARRASATPPRSGCTRSPPRRSGSRTSSGTSRTSTRSAPSTASGRRTSRSCRCRCTAARLRRGRRRRAASAVLLRVHRRGDPRLRARRRALQDDEGLRLLRAGGGSLRRSRTDERRPRRDAREADRALPQQCDRRLARDLPREIVAARELMDPGEVVLVHLRLDDRPRSSGTSGSSPKRCSRGSRTSAPRPEPPGERARGRAARLSRPGTAELRRRRNAPRAIGRRQDVVAAPYARCVGPGRGGRCRSPSRVRRRSQRCGGA